MDGRGGLDHDRGKGKAREKEGGLQKNEWLVAFFLDQVLVFRGRRVTNTMPTSNGTLFQGCC